MADYNSSLPITGSVAIASSVLVGVSGAIFDSGDMVGSVNIATDLASIGSWTGYTGSIWSMPAISTSNSANVEDGTEGLGSSTQIGGMMNGSTFPARLDAGSWLMVAGSISDLPTITDMVGSVTVGRTIEVSGAIFTGGDLTGSVSLQGIGSVIATIEGTVTTTATAGARDDLVVDYKTSASVAAAAIGSHGYISLGSLYVSRIMGGFSGKAKMMVLTSGTSAVPLAVGFNSTANPNMSFDFGESNGLLIGNGSGLSIIRYNRDTSAQDVYSSIMGYTYSA